MSVVINPSDLLITVFHGSIWIIADVGPVQRDPFVEIDGECSSQSSQSRHEILMTVSPLWQNLRDLVNCHFLLVSKIKWNESSPFCCDKIETWLVFLLLFFIFCKTSLSLTSHLSPSLNSRRSFGCWISFAFFSFSVLSLCLRFFLDWILLYEQERYALGFWILFVQKTLFQPTVPIHLVCIRESCTGSSLKIWSFTYLRRLFNLFSWALELCHAWFVQWAFLAFRWLRRYSELVFLKYNIWLFCLFGVRLVKCRYFRGSCFTWILKSNFCLVISVLPGRVFLFRVNYDYDEWNL